MKNRTILTLALSAILCAAISHQTTRAKAQPKPQGATIGCLIVTFIVGGVTIYGFYLICDRAFPEPPPTNAPPATNPPPTNVTVQSEYPYSISNYLGVFTMEIESSGDLIGWIAEGRVQMELSEGAATFITQSPDGTPLLTNRVAIGTMNYAGQTFWSVTNDASSVVRSRGEPVKLWRIK